MLDDKLSLKLETTNPVVRELVDVKGKGLITSRDVRQVRQEFISDEKNEKRFKLKEDIRFWHNFLGEIPKIDGMVALLAPPRIFGINVSSLYPNEPIVSMRSVIELIIGKQIVFISEKDKDIGGAREMFLKLSDVDSRGACGNVSRLKEGYSLLEEPLMERLESLAWLKRDQDAFYIRRFREIIDEKNESIRLKKINKAAKKRGKV